MNWWEWALTGVFGGAGGLGAVLASVTVYLVRNAEKVMPKIMVILQNRMSAKRAKKAQEAKKTDASIPGR